MNHSTPHCRGSESFTLLGISAGPGPRVVRASRSAPIDFRRGDRSPVGETRSAKAVGRGCGWRRLLGFVSRLRSVSPGTREPRDRSCLGLRLLQGCSGTCRASAGLDPVSDHQSPEPPWAIHSPVDDSNPLVGLPPRRRITRPSRRWCESCSRVAGMIIRDCEGLSLRGRDVPFSVLMRLMPCRPDQTTRPIRPAPCLRFCTVRE